MSSSVSKAFTSEDAPPEVLVRPRRVLAPGEKRYVTPQGERALRQALERLQEERAVTADPGRRAALEVQAQGLSDTLADLTVVVPDPAQAGRAFFGAWVTLAGADGEELRYRLVGLRRVKRRGGMRAAQAGIL